MTNHKKQWKQQKTQDSRNNSSRRRVFWKVSWFQKKYKNLEKQPSTSNVKKTNRLLLEKRKCRETMKSKKKAQNNNCALEVCEVWFVVNSKTCRKSLGGSKLFFFSFRKGTNSNQIFGGVDSFLIFNSRWVGTIGTIERRKTAKSGTIQQILKDSQLLMLMVCPTFNHNVLLLFVSLKCNLLSWSCFFWWTVFLFSALFLLLFFHDFQEEENETFNSEHSDQVNNWTENAKPQTFFFAGLNHFICTLWLFLQFRCDS